MRQGKNHSWCLLKRTTSRESQCWYSICAIRRAVQSEIKVEQQVMQQNQRDGTQPELFQNRVRAIWFQRLRKKFHSLSGPLTFATFRPGTWNQTKNAPASRGVRC